MSSPSETQVAELVSILPALPRHEARRLLVRAGLSMDRAIDMALQEGRPEGKRAAMEDEGAEGLIPAPKADYHDTLLGSSKSESERRSEDRSDPFSPRDYTLEMIDQLYGFPVFARQEMTAEQVVRVARAGTPVLVVLTDMLRGRTLKSILDTPPVQTLFLDERLLLWQTDVSSPEGKAYLARYPPRSRSRFMRFHWLSATEEEVRNIENHPYIGLVDAHSASETPVWAAPPLDRKGPARLDADLISAAVLNERLRTYLRLPTAAAQQGRASPPPASASASAPAPQRDEDDGWGDGGEEWGDESAEWLDPEGGTPPSAQPPPKSASAPPSSPPLPGSFSAAAVAARPDERRAISAAHADILERVMSGRRVSASASARASVAEETARLSDEMEKNLHIGETPAEKARRARAAVYERLLGERGARGAAPRGEDAHRAQRSPPPPPPPPPPTGRTASSARDLRKRQLSPSPPTSSVSSQPHQSKRPRREPAPPARPSEARGSKRKHESPPQSAPAPAVAPAAATSSPTTSERPHKRPRG